jgi:hypothetical protein
MYGYGKDASSTYTPTGDAEERFGVLKPTPLKV